MPDQPDFDDTPSARMPLDSVENIAAFIEEGIKARAVMRRDVSALSADVGRLDEGQLEMLRQQRDHAAKLQENTDATADMAVKLQENTDATAAIKADTADLIEILQMFKGLGKFVSWLGRAMRPLGYIAAACIPLLGLWEAIKRILHK